jgi:hypothetical protein
MNDHLITVEDNEDALRQLADAFEGWMEANYIRDNYEY